MRALRILGYVVGTFALIAAVAWGLRGDPIGPISGRALSGEEAPYPPDWDFTADELTIALEARPSDPHSVTTICFELDGDLYVPAQNGSKKRWTHYVEADPHVRLKIGDRVYPVRAVRVIPPDEAPFLEAAAVKYPRLAESDEPPDDVWLFRIEPRNS